MKKKVLSLVCMMFVIFNLTGCNIKFIEKVESEPSQEESTEEQFGDIIIDEPTTESSKTISQDTEVSENTETTTPEPSTEETPTESDGTFTYAGVKFIKDDQQLTMWVLEDCPAKTKPSMDSKDYTFLYKGDFVTLTAISSDNIWAMVSIYGGPSSFVEYDCLTTEEVSTSSQVASLPTEEPSSESSQEPETTSSQEPTSEPPVSSSQQPSQNSQSSQSSSQYVDPEPEEPVDDYTGISYPSNASATSYNMGVEFADVTVTLTVRKDDAQVSNGPDTPSNSSGYYSMATLSKGTTIKCTGIGRNGFVRVDYNGQVGFIDSRYVEY